MKYRAEIDGLRAMAVIPVILFHAGFEAFGGGFVGVDIFFVISGYLITTILLDDIRNNSFSLVKFYDRRARRILPPLFFILFLTGLFSFYFLPPHALKDIGQSIFAVSFFASNFFFYLETDYFNNTSEMAPLLHTWSLSVEEQFYIVFPFFLLAIKNSKKITKILVIICLLFISLCASELILQTNQAFSFFMVFTRFWELALGSLLAIIMLNSNLKFSKSYAEIFSFVGIFLILLSIFNYTKETPFPGFNALMPTIGTALIIMFATKSTKVGYALSFKPLVWIGLLSYSLYLSHNAIFSLCRNIGISLDTTLIQFSLIFISLIVAIFSFFFIERPLRFINVCYYKYLVSSVLVSIAFALCGYYFHITDGLKDYKISQLEGSLKANVIDASFELMQRKEIFGNFLAESEAPFDLGDTKTKVLILGDSMSEDFYVSMMINGNNDHYDFRRVYLDDVEMSLYSPISSENLDAYKIKKHNLFDAAEEIFLTATWQDSTNSRVADFVLWLLTEKKKVTIISSVNFNNVASLSYVAAKQKLKAEEIESFLFKNIREKWRAYFFSLKKKIQSRTDQVVFLEKLNAFCKIDEKTCNLRNGSSWLIYDNEHLSVEGAKHFGQYANKNWFIK